ncbi:MAG TPA: lipoate--protein ligase, partial [Micrococcus luteus]|nr:lipoate--protein ligase [Micrococcus luteus]
MSAAPRLRWAVQERTLGAAEDLDWAMDELAVFRAAAA